MEQPNPIGLSVVEIEVVKDRFIYVKKVDVPDQTPILDMKPFVPEFDVPRGIVRAGWLEAVFGHAVSKLSDGRFMG